MSVDSDKATCKPAVTAMACRESSSSGMAEEDVIDWVSGGLPLPTPAPPPQVSLELAAAELELACILVPNICGANLNLYG